MILTQLSACIALYFYDTHSLGSCTHLFYHQEFEIAAFTAFQMLEGSRAKVCIYIYMNPLSYFFFKEASVHLYLHTNSW